MTEDSKGGLAWVFLIAGVCLIPVVMPLGVLLIGVFCVMLGMSLRQPPPK